MNGESRQATAGLSLQQLRVHPSDGVVGNRGDLCRLAQVIEPHRLTARLGGCGLQRANAGVIAAIGHGLLQLLWGMGAAADQAVGAEQSPRLRWRQIPLAQMHPIGFHRQGQILSLIHI